MSSHSSSRSSVSDYPVQEHQDNTDSLCERCKGIDFSSLFNYISLTERTWSKLSHRARHCGLLDLGVLKEPEETTTCILCRFFYSVRWPQAPTSLDPVNHYHLRLFTTIEVSKSSFPKSGNMSGATVCSVVPGKLSEFTRETLDDCHEAYNNFCEPGTLLRANGYFVPDESWTPTSTTPEDGYGGAYVLAKGRRVDPKEVDFDLIKGWLRECDQDHIESRSIRSAPHSATPIRCIDCFSREVVKLPPGADYVALSYVWGGISAAGMVKREQEGTWGRIFVSKDVPQVIGDSIAVVKSIGKRYLWVDQCCIDQNDSADKMAQIQNMDNIYQGAYLTIVAAAGKDSTYGLPGVTSRPRKGQQLYVNIPGSFALVGSLPTAHEVIRNSIWATRGWTYQEAVLPRRLLIFTDYQAHLVCPAQIWCEDKAFDRGEEYTTETMVTHQPVPVLSQIFETKRYRRGATDLRDTLRHFEQFSTRDLTYEGDALDAIRGLLARCPFYTYYGVLVWRYDDDDEKPPPKNTSLPVEFFQSLWFFFEPCAENNIEVRRRVEFPSWSWLGWKAAKGVDYSKINPSLSNDEESEYRLERKATFWAEGNDGSHVLLVDLLPSATSSSDNKWNARVIPELSPYLWVENMVLKLRFQELEDHEKRPDYPDEGYPRAKFQDKDVGGWIDLVHRPRTRDDPLYQRLVTETWECLLLCCTFFDMKFLVLEWSDRTMAYSRIGTLDLFASPEQYEALLERVSHSVKKIRLG